MLMAWVSNGICITCFAGHHEKTIMQVNIYLIADCEI